MAERRCFSKEILGSDAFLELKPSAQALYIQLNMNADDDGVINNTKSIMQITNSKPDDLTELVNARFIFQFKDLGVVVIKHWWVHNNKRADRYKPTKYEEIFERICLKDNKIYTYLETWQPNGNQMSHKINKSKLKENKINKLYGEYQNVSLTDEEYEKLKTEFPNDYQERIERVSTYCASTGKKYKNYLATIRNWARKDKPNELPTYDVSQNIKISNEEQDEILRLMKG